MIIFETNYIATTTSFLVLQPYLQEGNKEAKEYQQEGIYYAHKVEVEK